MTKHKLNGLTPDEHKTLTNYCGLVAELLGVNELYITDIHPTYARVIQVNPQVQHYYVREDETP